MTPQQEQDKQDKAWLDGLVDGRENVVWRANRHPVECRESYESGFKEGQRERLSRVVVRVEGEVYFATKERALRFKEALRSGNTDGTTNVSANGCIAPAIISEQVKAS